MDPSIFRQTTFKLLKKNCLWMEGVGKMLIEQNEKKEDNHFSSISFTHVYQYMNMILFEWG